MASQRITLKTKLESDVTLATLLRGGWYDEFPSPRGGGLSVVQMEANNVQIKPFGVIRWMTTSMKEIISNSERRTVDFYLYHDSSWDVLEEARRRIKTLLHRVLLPSDHEGIGMYNWVQDPASLPTDELGGVLVLRSRFFVDYLRK